VHDAVRIATVVQGVAVETGEGVVGELIARGA
jgi:hypothetical protein